VSFRIWTAFGAFSKLLWGYLFRLVLGSAWYIKHKSYPSLEWARQLLEYRSLGLTRRYGALVQSRLPDGVVLQPFDNMPFINKEIYLTAVYTKFRKLTGDDVVLDVGAHVGVFTLMASRRVRRVVAIEPHPFNYKLLLRNITFNKLTNVTPVNVALSNYCGSAKLYIAEQSGSHTIEERVVDRYKVKHGFNVDRYVEVRVKTLDNLVDELGLDEVTFIKVDAEGSELNVLKGAERTLKENEAFLSIAAYHVPNELREISNFLRDIGYEVFIRRLGESRTPYIYASKR
jgi:FkbM family methyltransferase